MNRDRWLAFVPARQRMRRAVVTVSSAICAVIIAWYGGTTEAEEGHSERFPRRIWFACDFEARHDAVWVGDIVTNNIPRYPGNSTACGARRYGESASLLAAVKPVIPPRMNAENTVFFRYFCTSGGKMSVQLFTDGGNCLKAEIVMIPGSWREVWTAFHGDEGPLDQGTVMRELVFVAETKGAAERDVVLIDDVICFSNDPSLPEPPDEPFPRRVMGLWSFDVDDDYHPWTSAHYAIVPGDSKSGFWSVAKSVRHPTADHQWVRLIVEPLQAVGETTKLAFRYRQKNAPFLQVMMFDAVIQDNRRIVIPKPVSGSWTDAVLDFTRDGIWNGGGNASFSPGNRIDDIFFFPGFTGKEDVELYLDDVILFDAGVKSD